MAQGNTDSVSLQLLLVLEANPLVRKAWHGRHTALCLGMFADHTWDNANLVGVNWSLAGSETFIVLLKH